MLSDTPILVTGGSGFLGAHCVAELLGMGCRVRTTVRSPSKEDTVRRLVEEAGVDAGGRLSFAVADLLGDRGWDDAMAGVERVLHVASPFPAAQPKDPDALLVPARDGTLRVLHAANAAGATRVVLTSSVAAVAYGHPRTDQVYTEDDWTDVDGGVTPYVRSKTLAERAAWEYVERDDVDLELAVINPVGVFGPVLGGTLSSSVLVVRQMLDGAVPRVPDVHIGIVDVRDVADLHVRCLDHPAAAGQRFIATAGVRSLRDIATTLTTHLGDAASKVSTKPAPSFAVRAAARFNANARRAAPDLGVIRRATSEKAKRVLDWEPRSPEEAVLATARSLIARR